MVTPTWPTADTRWRCSQCGNKTRFDVVRSSRVREYVHLDLAGNPEVEETEVLSETLEEVRCRWCGSTGSIEAVPRPIAEPDSTEESGEPPASAVVEARTEA